MSKKQKRKASISIGLAAGILADGYLRLISGEEGNLLVHTVVILFLCLIFLICIYYRKALQYNQFKFQGYQISFSNTKNCPKLQDSMWLDTGLYKFTF